MHRRKGTQISETDHGGDNLPSSPTTRRRTSPPSSIKNGARKHPNKVGLGIMLVVLFSALIAIEFIAYRMLGETTPPPSTSIGSTADTTTSSDSDAQIVTNAAVHETNNDRNSFPKQNDALTPTKHPTTFQPTKAREGWQAKAARRDSNAPNQFWKKHSPEPLPPLPPDVDPTTGEKLPPVIAYVTTLTKCGPKHRGGLDGAAVLLHSIRRNSYGWVPMEKQTEQSKSDNTQNKGDDDNDGAARPLYGGEGGRYRFRAYVIVDPNASPQNIGKSGECARFLRKIGYTVLHRPPLVPLFELPDDPDENSNPNGSHYDELKSLGYVGMHRPPSSLRAGEHPDKLRKFMHNDGCCGYTEMLKLHVYGMVEHELAVHLDFDSLLLRPMDDLFDAMLGKRGEDENENGSKLPLATLPRTREVDRTRPIDAAFTRDYNSVNRPGPDAPVGYQGGFLAVRPDARVLERYREVLRTGDFLLGPRDGWGGKVGGFYGDVTFQGILPYYYEQVAPKEGVAHNEAELDRCVFNQMADNPRKSTYKFPRATPLDAKKMVRIHEEQFKTGSCDSSFLFHCFVILFWFVVLCVGIPRYKHLSRWEEGLLRYGLPTYTSEGFCHHTFHFL